MIHKFKQWLGIEGVKIELLIPESLKESDQFIDGRIVLKSKTQLTISQIQLKAVEKYTRGRGNNKKMDEFVLGTLNLEQEIVIPPSKEIYIDFALPFERIKSEMDQYSEKNILTKGIVKAAKSLHNVQSDFRVEAIATVKGTVVQPFDKKSIIIHT